MIVWWRMARPLQLLSIVLVYTLGALMAQAMTEAFDSARFIGSLLVLLPVAVSVHYANEYADVETDALTARTPFSGGSGAFMQSNLPRRAQHAYNHADQRQHQPNYQGDPRAD